MNLITVGKIVKPRGLKGEVKVLLYTNYSDAIKNIKNFYVGTNQQKMQAKTVSLRDGFAYILFKEISSIEMAETLRNLEVSIVKSEFEISENDVFLIEDIIGCEVFDEKNLFVGEIIEIEQYGAADVWILRGNGRTVSFPYISDIVKKIDVKNKRIVINKKKFEESKV